jgi:hypothetical protein
MSREELLARCISRQGGLCIATGYMIDPDDLVVAPTLDPQGLFNLISEYLP